MENKKPKHFCLSFWSFKNIMIIDLLSFIIPQPELTVK
jgi:hypothetical protein